MEKVLLLVVLLVRVGQCSRILLLPMNHRSHMMYFNQLSKGLVNNGHQVTMVFGSRMPMQDKMKASGAQIKPFHMKYEPIAENKDVSKKMIEAILADSNFGIIHEIGKILDNMTHEMAEIWQDKALLNELREESFDFIITEPFGWCVLLAYELQVPYATLLVESGALYMRRPIFPSHEPSTMYSVSAKLTLKQRFVNYL